MGIEAAIIGGVVAGAGSAAGGAIQAGGAKDAASAQLTANRESIAAQERMAEKAAGLLREQSAIAREDLAPFRAAQLGALNSIQSLTTPGSDLEIQQRKIGQEEILRNLSAQGLTRSKAQTDLLSNLELGLNQQRYDRLNQLAGLGAAQQSAQVSQNLGGGLAGIYGGLGQQVGQSIHQQGQIMGQNSLNQANLLAGGIQGIGNAFQGSLNNIVQSQVYKKLGLL